MKQLFEIKWPNGYACPRCSNRQASEIRSRRLPLYQCRRCRHQASLTVGTVMEKSKTTLRKWFRAMLEFARGACASQVALIIDVTYKTAWTIEQKIRHAVHKAESEIRLADRVCIQEEYYSATSLSGSCNLLRKKQPLLAAASVTEDNDLLQIKLHQIPSSRLYAGRVNRPCFQAFVDCGVAPGTEPRMVIGIARSGRQRDLTRVCYHIFRYLNTVFQGIGPKHLQAYLDQFVYLSRLIQTDGGSLPIDDLLRQCVHRSALTYPALVQRSFA